MRRALSQAARAASHTKATYLAARYRRRAARRGAKRAIIAIAHYLLKADRPYEDLSADYFDRINAEGLKRYLLKRRERRGHHVVLSPALATA